MSEKSKLSVFQILVRIFLAIVSLVCLLMSIFFLITSFKEEPLYGPMIIFLVLAILFAPFYASVFGSMGKSFEGVKKATPFIRGGLFVLRLFALFILTMFFITEFDRIKVELFSVFNVSASSSEMAGLVRLIENDQRWDLEAGIVDLQNQEKNIDFNLLLARNFETALNHANEEIKRTGPGSEIYYLEMRLQYPMLPPVDSVFAVLSDYKSSDLSKHISPAKMLDLLLAYGEFYFKYDSKETANRYFEGASLLNPADPEVVLGIGDIKYRNKYLSEAAETYKQYISLMKNDGQENKIPRRVTEFVESGLYGSNLQKSLYECWLFDRPVDPWDNEEYYQTYDIDYMKIGDRIFTSFWGNFENVLFGTVYYYEEDTTTFGFAGCVARLLGQEPEKMDFSALEELMGMELYGKSGLPFTAINPEAIDWAMRNLVPDPDLEIFDKSCVRIYNTVLRDACRRKALAYAFLNSYFDTQSDADEYEYEMYNEDFHAIDFLVNKYQSNAEFSGRGEEDPWTLIEDAGFWLRRIIDGSEDECWKLLAKVMNQYDEVWFDHVWEGWEYYDEYPEEYYEEEYYEEDLDEGY